MRHMYIVYNRHTMKIVCEFEWIGDAIKFVDKHSNDPLAFINRTHPFNAEILAQLTV